MIMSNRLFLGQFTVLGYLLYQQIVLPLQVEQIDQSGKVGHLALREPEHSEIARAALAACPCAAATFMMPALPRRKSALIAATVKSSGSV